VKAYVHITLKKGVLDPQGKAIGNALRALGFDAVQDVRQGKYIELNLKETDPTRAQTLIDDICNKLLANSVIEDYRIDLKL
jgi:phosphoribosylformylglycinamidine synthase PurS subunit